MTIRFRTFWQSEIPDAPFRPGQVIHVDQPTAGMLEALRGGHAEALKDDEGVEFATVRAPRPARKARSRSTH